MKTVHAKPKRALNLDLALPKARSRREDPCCIFFMDVGAFCVELWSFYCRKRISVPMSYISWLDIDVHPNVSRYTRTCPATTRRDRDRPCLILLTITNGTSPDEDEEEEDEEEEPTGDAILTSLERAVATSSPRRRYRRERRRSFVVPTKKPCRPREWYNNGEND